MTNFLDIFTRHQTAIEGLKQQEVNDYTKHLKEISAVIALTLAQSEELTTFSRTRLEKLLSAVNSELTVIYNDYYDKLSVSLINFADYEAEFTKKSLDSVLDAVKVTTIIPTTKQLISALKYSPMGIEGTSGGKLLEPFIKDWTASDQAMIVNAIRKGSSIGLTNSQIIQSIRGTKAKKYTDGVLSMSAKHADAIVRTSVQHVATQARLETMKANDDVLEGYEFNATLDSRTTTQCRSLDGQVFDFDEPHPVPPLHIRCRSNLIPKLKPEYDYLNEGATRSSEDGYVDGDLTYYDWLKSQPVNYQDDVLGATRGKLFRDGGLSASEFARLQLDRNFEPLTLNEMRAKEPLAFERAEI